MRSLYATCLLIGALVTAGTVFPTPEASAETYVGGMIGASFGAKAGNIEITDPLVPPGTKSTDLDLQSSVAYGAKFGHYFDTMPWLGAEAEVYTSTKNVKEQPVTLTTPSGESFSGTVPKSDGRVTVLGFNALVRYPHGRLQPYAGAGLGIFIATASDGQRDTAPGLNALAGVKFKVSDHIGAFVEYKYNRADLSFSSTNTALGFDTTYQAHQAMVGVSYHF